MVDSLEQQNLKHVVLVGTQIDATTQMLLVNGIWYHYHFADLKQHPIVETQKYRIVAIDGNQLTITQQ